MRSDDPYGFTAFEAKLFELAADSSRIRQYRRSSLVRGILFSLLLAGAWFSFRSCPKPMPSYVDPLLALALGGYALLTSFTLRNFHRALAAYRSILAKIQSKQSGTEAVSPEDSNREKQTKVAVFLLTAFYCTVLIAWTLHALPHAALPVVTIFFLLASAALKMQYADLVIAWKKRCIEAASEKCRDARSQ